eukprot:TRINITY_DN662_c0_g2_i1.p1 TRINITY_DN662_c0_g2~~TRINITY_DN662_c0_g2_i1.p1  ORF type:complete len:935 (-),score=258.75 TRINITY_DN662_c0_g2_i1:185-2989(-)
MNEGDSRNRRGGDSSFLDLIHSPTLTREALETALLLGASLEEVDDQGRNLLHHAIIAKSNLNTIEFFLENTSFLNSNDELSCTPLHHAALQGNIKLCQLLLSYKADVKLENKEKTLPLHLLVKNTCSADDSNGYLEVVEKFAKGVNINHLTTNGDSPLHFACTLTDSHLPVIRHLLPLGADPNLKNNEGKTPFHQAIINKNVPLVNLLIQYKAAIDIPFKNITCFQLASETSSKALLRIIREQMVKIRTSSDSDDEGPLELDEVLNESNFEERDIDKVLLTQMKSIMEKNKKKSKKKDKYDLVMGQSQGTLNLTSPRHKDEEAAFKRSATLSMKKRFQSLFKSTSSRSYTSAQTSQLPPTVAINSARDKDKSKDKDKDKDKKKKKRTSSSAIHLNLNLNLNNLTQSQSQTQTDQITQSQSTHVPSSSTKSSSKASSSSVRGTLRGLLSSKATDELHELKALVPLDDSELPDDFSELNELRQALNSTSKSSPALSNQLSHPPTLHPEKLPNPPLSSRQKKGSKKDKDKSKDKKKKHSKSSMHSNNNNNSNTLSIDVSSKEMDDALRTLQGLADAPPPLPGISPRQTLHFNVDDLLADLQSKSSSPPSSGNPPKEPSTLKQTTDRPQEEPMRMAVGTSFVVNEKEVVLLQELGRGATATVWLASIESNTVALKSVSLSGVRNKKAFRVMVAAEVEMMMQFQHQNIIKYYGEYFLRKLQEMHIILEYVEGGCVTQLVKSRQSLSEPIASNITFQVLQGVAFLHRNHIIHRDIKPDNMLLTSDGTVKLIDFGVSTKVLKTMRKTSVGTPWYTAPEVINAESYSYLADIWSVGCSVIEMLSGKPPYGEFNAVTALFKMAESSPPLPSCASPICSAFLSRCLIRQQCERPNAEILLRDEWLSEFGQSARLAVVRTLLVRLLFPDSPILSMEDDDDFTYDL